MTGILTKSIPSVIVIFLGILTLILLYFENYDASFVENKRRFIDFSEEYIDLVKKSLIKNIEYSNTYNTLANIIDNIILEDFNVFANDILAKDVEIGGISYIPVISNAERSNFESYAQGLYNDSSLYIACINETTGQKVPQIEKDFYYPILFGAIEDTNFTLPLIDAGDDLIRLRYFKYINDTCKSYLLPPTEPLQNRDREELSIVYEPFYDQNEMNLPCHQRTLKGFTSISFFLSKLVLNVVNQLSNEKVSINIFNNTKNDEVLLTAITNNANKWEFSLEETKLGSFENKETIDILGQFWTIKIRDLESFLIIKINIEELIIIGAVIIILGILVFLTVYYWERRHILSIRHENFQQKEEFIRYVLHEIRVPLNTITLGINLLKYPPSSISRTSLIKSIKKSSLQASKILNDIIDLENIENNRFKIIKTYIPITELIRCIYMDNIYFSTKKRIDFDFLISDELNDKAIYCDEKRITQVLNNIVGNAVKFTQDEGNIHINVRVIDVETPSNLKVPESSTFEKNKVVMFEVTDDGIGIKEEEKNNIFVDYDKIIKNSQEENRTGLGLSISKSLIKLHSGDIGFESKHGKGSKFYFVLPYCYNIIEDSESSDYLKGIGELRNMDLKFKSKEVKNDFSSSLDIVNVKSEDIEHKASENIKILIVEDNKSNQQYLKGILELEGFEIDIADDGSEAIDKVGHKDYSFILMDNKMKPIDGVTATKEILKLKPEQKIIGITGMSSKVDVDNFLASGAKQVFTKPLDFEFLLNFITGNK